MKKIILTILVMCVHLFPQYHTHNELTRNLQQLSKKFPVVTVESLIKTIKGNDVWVATIGKGETQNRKAILVVGGIEASSLVGSEHAVRFIQNLAESYGKTDSITRLLDNTTVYVIPRANPDASESFFTKPVVERETNYNPFDSDGDALVDEDDVEFQECQRPCDRRPHTRRIPLGRRYEDIARGAGSSCMGQERELHAGRRVERCQ